MKRNQSIARGRAARLLTLAALVAAALATGSVAARAGLGSLTKSAKDKAAKAAGQKPAEPAKSGSAVQFDETTLELTGDRLDQLIACRKAAAEVTKDRPKQVEREDKIQAEINDLNARNSEAIIANTNQRNEVQNCWSAGLNEMRQQKMQAMMTRVQSNPQLIQQISDVSTEMSQATASGDTAKANRLQQELWRLTGFGRADTLAVEKKCGKVPPVHPAQVRIEALIQEGNALLATMRHNDEKAIQIQKEKSGMTEEQLGMAWDRIKDFLAGRGNFSDAERKALGERKDILAPLAL